MCSGHQYCCLSHCHTVTGTHRRKTATISQQPFQRRNPPAGVGMTYEWRLRSAYVIRSWYSRVTTSRNSSIILLDVSGNDAKTLLAEGGHCRPALPLSYSSNTEEEPKSPISLVIWMCLTCPNLSHVVAGGRGEAALHDDVMPMSTTTSIVPGHQQRPVGTPPIRAPPPSGNKLPLSDGKRCPSCSRL